MAEIASGLTPCDQHPIGFSITENDWPNDPLRVLPTLAVIAEPDLHTGADGAAKLPCVDDLCGIAGFRLGANARFSNVGAQSFRYGISDFGNQIAGSSCKRWVGMLCNPLGAKHGRLDLIRCEHEGGMS